MGVLGHTKAFIDFGMSYLNRKGRSIHAEDVIALQNILGKLIHINEFSDALNNPQALITGRVKIHVLNSSCIHNC